MIFGKRKYPLPKFPHNVISTFKGFCEELPDERVKEFMPEVRDCVEHFRVLSKQYLMLDMNRVEALGAVSLALIEDYPNHTSAEKRLIVGAIRYFANTDDAVSETAFASGLSDDAQVMNYVLEEVKRLDLVLDFG